MARNSVKFLLAAILSFAGIVPAQAQNAYPLFEPADGILVGDQDTYVTTAATAADVLDLWTSCSSTVFLRGDGACSLIDLLTNVTGTLPAANGGTGVTSLGTLTDTDDTNVTLTLTGTPTNSLIRSVGITAGWSGTLAASRGGLGFSTVTDDTVPIANGTGWVSSALPGCLDVSGNHLNYNTTTNSVFCGTSSSVSPVSPADPTGVIGLTAVNGVSPNFIRSDASQALSQAIAPTWSAQHLYSSSGIGASTAIRLQSASPWVGWRETDSAAGAQDWLLGVSGGSFVGTVSNDGSALDSLWLNVARSGATTSNLSFGNAVSNPTYSWLGSGLSTYSGSIQVNGDHIAVANSDTYMELRESDAGADGKVWWMRGNGNALSFSTRTDANAAGQDALQIGRSGVAVTSLSFGNATGNPTYSFLGTGVATFGGNLTSTGVGRFGGSSSAPLRLNALDTVGDNYIQAYSSDGTTPRWYVGNGGTADNNLTLSNDTAAGVLSLQTAAGRVQFMGGSEVRNVSDAGFYSFYNTANSVRSGYLQGGAAGLMTLENEVAGGTLNLISPAALNVDVAGGTDEIAVTSGAVSIPGTATIGTATMTSATVGGSAVCRADGTNCPASSGTYTTVFKASATDRSSTTTLAADADLTFTSAASAVYSVRFCLVFAGVTTGTQGFKFAFNGNGAGTDPGSWSGGSRVNGAGASHDGLAAGLASGDTTGQVAFATITVGNQQNNVCGVGSIVTNGTRAYAIEWAQNSSSANATRLGQGSFLEYRRIN